MAIVAKNHTKTILDEPEMTACKLSVTIERQIKGVMTEMSCTTCFSLLKARPRMCRLQKRAIVTAIVSVATRNMTAQTATRAFCGFPAPNSFETRVLKYDKMCVILVFIRSYI